MRSYHQLTQMQRYQISALQSLGHSYTEIAHVIQVHKSTVSREIARNTSSRGYRPFPAHQNALHRRRPPVYRISTDVWEQVFRLLRQDWSPEQISGRLKREQAIRISPEWIYQYVFANRRLGGTLFQHLRCLRKRKKRGRVVERRGRLPNIQSIDLRPAIVNRRGRLGDWEVDTLVGKRTGQVLVTLTERKSRLTLLALAENQSSAAVRRQICRLLLPYKEKAFSLTSDRGSEFAEHVEIATTLGALSGAFLAVWMPTTALAIIFGAAWFLSSLLTQYQGIIIAVAGVAVVTASAAAVLMPISLGASRLRKLEW